jgi:anti-sigma regulatory factor (Ser/Thr protein kinase)
MMVHSSWSHATTLPPEPASASRSRGFVRSHLDEHGLSAIREDVELVTSELATNAVRHAGTRFTLSLDGDGHLVRLSVEDAGVGATLEPSTLSDGAALDGRGLFLVSARSSDWGVIRGATSTTVWASFAVPGS